MVSTLLKRFPRVEKLARRMVSLYPLSARLGDAFWQWYAFLDESQSWRVQEIERFRFERLRSLLPLLRDTSPFYARRLAGVSIDQINTVEDFRRQVPTLTRQEFAANYSEILSRDHQQRRCYRSSTSGTTGNALQFLHPAENRAREWASICHQWKRVGFDPARSRRAEFRGLTLPGELYQSFPDQNMVRFSILDLQAKNLPAMRDLILAQQLRFYHGYPSALFLLADEIIRCGVRFPEPEAVLLASEMVYDFQLERIQAAFPKARLFAHYGCSEWTVLAAWCEHRRAYHVLPQYSLVEVDGKTGEIIGTNLYNDVNGFIRYRMTDSASGVETVPCAACRRPYATVFRGIDGRQEDYLFSRERGWIAPAIVTYPLKHLHHIQELQFHQDDPDKLLLKYVPRPAAAMEQATTELAEIETGLRRLVGREVGLVFERVQEIPRGPTGKYKWIVSRLEPPYMQGGQS
jgi:phenylacetate-coenzyme A ligase PaaK-like adenylate-forming protein